MNAHEPEHSSFFIHEHLCFQGRRNVGPPQSMALGTSEQPAGQLQPSLGPQLMQRVSAPGPVLRDMEPATEYLGENGRESQGLHIEGEAGSAGQQAAASSGVVDAERSNSMRPEEGSTKSSQEPIADSFAASCDEGALEVTALLHCMLKEEHVH